MEKHLDHYPVIRIRTFVAIASLMLLALPLQASEEITTVNVDNFVHAENDMQMDRMLQLSGGINLWAHNRQPTPLDKQNVIRMNRDTIYSFAVVDISEGATVTLPETDGRYMTMMVINNDGYINNIYKKAGDHELTLEEFDTPYVSIAVRTLVDSSDPADVATANKLQDEMKIKAASAKPFKMPQYDMTSYQATYKPLLELSKGIPDTHRMFGKRNEVDPVRFTLGTAFGWGGLPAEDAYYLNEDPELPVGEYQITVKDVPVDAFWSISIYNKDGYFQKNDSDSYSVNNISGTANADGSFTINFGGCADNRVNCLPLTEGWNYIVRLYEPRKEILDGTWTFPKPEPATP